MSNKSRNEARVLLFGIVGVLSYVVANLALATWLTKDMPKAKSSDSIVDATFSLAVLLTVLVWPGLLFLSSLIWEAFKPCREDNHA